MDLNEKASRTPADKASAETLAMIARARALTREYYLSDYTDTEGRQRILTELLAAWAAMSRRTHPFTAITGKIFLSETMLLST